MYLCYKDQHRFKNLNIKGQTSFYCSCNINAHPLKTLVATVGFKLIDELSLIKHQ